MADNTIFDVPNEVALDLTGKTIMVHDLAQPEATSTVLVTFENLKSEVQKETQNGLVITGGNTELGGDIIHPTTVNLNGNQLTFLNNPLSGFGYYPFGSLEQYIMIEELNNNLGVLSISNNTTIGSEQITSGVSVKGLVSNSEAGFYNAYNLALDEQTTYWRKYTTIDGNIVAALTKDNGLVIQPFSQVGVDTYLGDNIFKIVDTLNVDIFKIKINGIINELLPPYADDADAGANGLVAGDRYQTSGAGASPLNVAGMVMTKQ